ncbi:MAG TPA: hypothetical protein VI136_17990 [Verrucomicrobiae bacterium]
MTPPDQINLATLYSGQACHAIDGSNRIMLPADWRVDGAPAQFFVMVSASEDFLLVCPPAVYETFLNDLRNQTANKRLIPEMERLQNERVRRVSLDRFGRLPLPPEFMARVGIVKEGFIVGRCSKLEIWARDRYEKARPERQQAEAIYLEQLARL